MVLHKDLSGADLHEVKGADTATGGYVMVADGAGSTNFVDPLTIGAFYIEHLFEGGHTSDQDPSGTDSPMVVSFGNSISNPYVSLDSSGVLTANETGLYRFTFTLNLGRPSGGTGVSILVWRILVNDLQISSTRAAQIATPDTSIPYQETIVLDLDQSDTVKIQLMRDSAGANDGGLRAHDPTLAGWLDQPSAAVSVARYVGSP